MSMNLNAEIATLKQMTVHELQDRYIDVFGERTRSNHKQYLIKRIAWPADLESFEEALPGQSLCSSSFAEVYGERA